jgi:hypothetical protein
VAAAIGRAHLSCAYDHEQPPYDNLAGKRGRSQFLVGAATYEVKRQRQLAALRAATGAWKLADHPELKGGSVSYQRKLRAEGERRLERQTARSAGP